MFYQWSYFQLHAITTVSRYYHHYFTIETFSRCATPSSSSHSLRRLLNRYVCITGVTFATCVNSTSFSNRSLFLNFICGYYCILYDWSAQVCTQVLNDLNNVRVQDVSRQDASPIRFLRKKDKKNFEGGKRKKER